MFAVVDGPGVVRRLGRRRTTAGAFFSVASG